MDSLHVITRPRFNIAWLISSAMVIGTILAASSGCSGGKTQWDVTHPVTGTVTYKGKAISDAEISFFPSDDSAPDSVRPRAKSIEGGKFVAWTYQNGDGLPAGDYKVTVVHNEVAVSKDTIVAKPNDLPAKYSRLDSTDLSVTVAKGKNEDLKLELK